MACFSYNGEKYTDHPNAVYDHFFPHLVILKIKLLLLEEAAPLQLNYLISLQIHGRQKLHFLTVHLRKFIYKLHLGTQSLSVTHWHMFSIYWYGLISRQSSVLIMGARCDNGSSASLIAKYTIDKWERVGNLQHPRHWHRAISNDDRIYVVGGEGTL